MDLGLTATLLGSGLKGLGQIQSGYDADLAYQFNAAVARANAAAVQTSSDFDIARLKKAKKSLSSAQLAGYSKAGVKMEGSPIDVMINSAAEAEIDILINKYNTQMKTISLNAQAEQDEASGKSAIRQGWLGAGSTLLSTVGSFYTGMNGVKSVKPGNPIG